MTRPFTRTRLMLDRCDLEWGVGEGQCAGYDVDYRPVTGAYPDGATLDWTRTGVSHVSVVGARLLMTACGTDQSMYHRSVAPTATIYAILPDFSMAAGVTGNHYLMRFYTGARLNTWRLKSAVIRDAEAGTDYAVDLTASKTIAFVVDLVAGSTSVYVGGVLLAVGYGTADATAGKIQWGKVSTTSDTSDVWWGGVRYAIDRDPSTYPTLTKLCRRTFGSCQNVVRYSATPKTLALCTAHQAVPPGIQAYPCISKIDHVPTRIDMKGGLGRRDQVVVDCDDFEDCADILDPYWRRRPAWAQSSSFFARLKAIHRHHANRTMYVDKGELGDDGRVVEADLVTTRYVLDRIERSGGGWQIVAKDVLWRLENATFPPPSQGELAAALNATDDHWSFYAGDGADYPAATFVVKIDREIMLVGTRTGDAVTSVTRGAWGTTAATHDIDRVDGRRHLV